MNRLFDTYVPDPHPAPPGEQPNFQLILACNPHYLNHLRLLLPGVLTGLTRSHETASYQQARWYSAVINCGRFVQTYHGASPQGRAALLEQATQGALDWVRARPRGPDDPAPLHARFQRGVDSVIHHRAMLMLPLHTIPLGCQGCGESDAFLDPCHFASCPCGIRASDSLHHPVRDLTADMLKQVFGSNRVLVDTEMGDSYTVYSAIKRPDLVVQHALGSGAHLVIDVKTVDGTGSTAIERSHTDVSALGGLTEVERALWDEYTDSGRRPDAIPAGIEEGVGFAATLAS